MVALRSQPSASGEGWLEFICVNWHHPAQAGSYHENCFPGRYLQHTGESLAGEELCYLFCWPKATSFESYAQDEDIDIVQTHNTQGRHRHEQLCGSNRWSCQACRPRPQQLVSSPYQAANFIVESHERLDGKQGKPFLSWTLDPWRDVMSHINALFP
jgi:hypothetical protein